MWLIVQGTGSWGYADSNRQMRTFPAGKHEIDEETAGFVRRSGNAQLILVEDEPEIARRVAPKTVAEAIRNPVEVGAVYIPETEHVPIADQVDANLIPMSWPCGLDDCADEFPSPGALQRHREFHHASVNS